MSNSKAPEVYSATSSSTSESPTPHIVINADAAAETRQKANARLVARADVVNLRDDPEAKAAFLSTFTADEEKRIMSKVNKIFFVLTGLMYLIKQVSLLNPRYR